MSIVNKPISAKNIVDLLSMKHHGDVFVPECKNGPSLCTSHSRLDVWAMKRSWTNPQIHGYEIKVSRGDYLQDDKWPNYLGYCNQFWFVCPTGLISVEECPQDAGLMWVARTGTRLYTKKKAPYRNDIDPEVLDSLFRYILYSRAVITKEYCPEGKSDLWQRWLEEKDENKYIGRNVSHKIRQIVAQRIEMVDRENERLQKEIKSYAKAKKMLDDLGIRYASWDISREISESIQAYRSLMQGHRIKALESLHDDLGKFLERKARSRIDVSVGLDEVSFHHPAPVDQEV